MIRTHRLGPACVLLFLCPMEIHGQAAPRDLFLICGSQPNEPTVYVSGVMQGPVAAFQGFRNGFAMFLSQRYGYKGAVGCAPANTAAIAQNFLNTRAAALRNQKKIVVETGWTEPAALAAAPPVVPAMPAPQQATTAAAASSGGAGNGGSQLSSVLAAVLGSASGTGGSGAARTPTSNTSTPGSAPDQGGAAQVASTLAAVFSKKSSSNSSTADAQVAPGIERSEGLGGAQGKNTKLVVYGCGRQDMQVACVTEVTNEDHKDTLIQSGAIWRDAFIVDDRGDRHQRSDGFLLNTDGEQRPQLDVSYGKAVRFVLMFDGVPEKVQKVALRSAAEGLDVEDISLVAPPDSQ